MKYSWGIFVIAIALVPLTAMAVDFPTAVSDSAGKSFLAPKTFPNTFSDLSFSERMDVLRSGYEPWESEYDDEGRCLTNCAYPGITIEDDLKSLQRNTDAARDALALYQQGTVTAFPVPTVGGSDRIIDFPPVDNAASPQTYRCNPVNSAVPVNQTIPFGRPLIAQTRVTSPYGERVHPITKKRQVHKGIDFLAPVGTDVYSAAAGAVESVWTDQTCGRGLRIKHGNGFSSLYCHLSDYNVKPGDPVNAGCVVAKTGNTGRSTGPHLHYGLYYNDNLIDPSDYVKN